MHVLTIEPNGAITLIYNDKWADLLTEGDAQIKRASHVEPNSNGPGWVADLAPVGGPALGPFPLRQEALDAEIAWINANVLGVQNEC